MINFLQSNHRNINKNIKLLSNSFFEDIHKKLQKKKNPIKILTCIHVKQNIEKKELIINFIYYLLKYKIETLSSNTIKIFE